MIDAYLAMYAITDAGTGFDHQKAIDEISGNIRKANSAMAGHGRGLAFALNAFDDILFNHESNMVTVVTKIPAPVNAGVPSVSHV